MKGERVELPGLRFETLRRVQSGLWGTRTSWFTTLAQRTGCRDGAPVLLLFLLAILATICAAQETVLHVEVKLVSVFVNVTDQNGAIVGGLTKDDFHVAEDGRPQEIAVFERQSE